jgi:hypothetical protein
VFTFTGSFGLDTQRRKGSMTRSFLLFQQAVLASSHRSKRDLLAGVLTHFYRYKRACTLHLPDQN